MTDEWADAAPTWDDNPAVRAYAAAAWTDLGEILSGSGHDLAGASVCDFGCGTGLLTERLVDAGSDVVAIDPSTAMRDVLLAKLAMGDASASVTVRSALEADDSQFDLIVASSVLSFVDDLSAVVADLGARLRPGGLLVHWDWERSDGSDDLGLSREQVQAAHRAAGLDLRRLDTAFELEFDGMTMRPLVAVAAAASV